ncbi:Gfo/Idh/MocA family protein [Crateriforma conspicua]|uniref:1,5-anhydro-D-fructose reductase n=1 Tax=Crateriforma conspicua TaxID=2527996 RepID=A0A5C6FT11_9PLAN|nr:Gfo/Idh/MocA family oxidoreductase [Crateriforma conspicua]TWU64610.1 1,5-anhydro-D-fructose reductase [Crateriforma conspicua]
MEFNNRRQFVKTAVAASTIAAVHSSTAPAKADSPNGTIRVAVVGLGGRGRRSLCVALRELSEQNVQIVAMSDVNEKRMNDAADEHEMLTGKRPKTAVDMRSFLKDDDIDAVVLATPNHWHALQTIWCCQAGKDVYVEKPASHNLTEGRLMIEAARKYERMVQVGTQCRTSEKIRDGIAKLNEGVIGRVYSARAIAFKFRAGGKHQYSAPPAHLNWDLWVGPAPQSDYDQLAIGRWRYMREYGNGQIGDQGVHQLDIVRWGLGLDTHPSRMQCMTVSNFRPTSDEDTGGQQVMACTYAGKDEGRDMMVQFETRDGYTNDEAGMGTTYPFVDHKNVVGVIFLGTEGYMVIPDYSSYHTFLGPKREPGPSDSVPGAPMMDADHVKNWLDVIRSRKYTDLFADIAEGHLSASICHLANASSDVGRTLTFDADSEMFEGDSEANRLLTREYRSPYVLPESI